MKKKNLLVRIIVTVFLTMLLIVLGGLSYLARGLDQNIALDGLQLVDLDDGIYTGSFDHGRWSNEVRVKISNHKIIGIEVVKDVIFRKPGLSDEVFDRVIAAQDTTIDAISQATITTKAYLKAIESALRAD